VTLGGKPSHSKLARGERVDTAQSRPARARAREESLAAGSLGDRDGAAPRCDLERLAQRIPGRERVAEAAKSGAQVELSPGQFEHGRRLLEGRGRLLQQLDRVRIGAQGRQRAKRDPGPSPDADAASQTQVRFSELTSFTHRRTWKGGRVRARHLARRRVEAPVEVTTEVAPGVVSLPDGWGHNAPGTRMRTPAARPGVNSNLLSDDAAVDPLSGNAVLNGIPVHVEAV
jgi:hypothetical protein